jgi:hypothetical protein
MIQGSSRQQHHMHEGMPGMESSPQVHSHHMSSMTEHGIGLSLSPANVFLLSGASTMPKCEPALVAGPRFKAEDGSQSRHVIVQAPRVHAPNLMVSEFDGSLLEDLGPPANNPTFSVLRI